MGALGALATAGCGEEHRRPPAPAPPAVDNRNWGRVLSAPPGSYRGAPVRLVGRVYSREPSRFLMWADYLDGERPVQVSQPQSRVAAEELVLVEGRLAGRSGGLAIIAPRFVRAVSEAEALSIADPAARRQRVDASQTHQRLTVSVESIGWTRKRTLLELRVRNHGRAPATLAASSTVLTQGAKRYEQQAGGYEAGLAAAVPPRRSRRGTLVHERVPEALGRAELRATWYSASPRVIARPFRIALRWTGRSGTRFSSLVPGDGTGGRGEPPLRALATVERRGGE